MKQFSGFLDDKSSGLCGKTCRGVMETGVLTVSLKEAGRGGIRKPRGGGGGKAFSLSSQGVAGRLTRTPSASPQETL